MAKEIITLSPTATITIDPLDQYQDVPASDLLEGAGLLHDWILEAIAFSTPIKENLLFHYKPYFLGEMNGCTVTENGTLSYPGDPDLFPILKYTAPGTSEVLFIYKHGIVAIRDTKENTIWITRMD